MEILQGMIFMLHNRESKSKEEKPIRRGANVRQTKRKADQSAFLSAA
jgi:hypothetical protein